MAIGSLNQILRSDVGNTSSNTSVVPIRTDVNLVNINISDKLQELANTIAKSTETQATYDKTVLDLTVGAIAAEFKILLTDKLTLTSSDTAADIKAGTNDAFSRIDATVFETLRYAAVKQAATRPSGIKPVVDTFLNTTLQPAVATIFENQTKTYGKVYDMLNNNLTALGRSVSAIHNLQDTHTKHKTYSNIFQRIAIEAKERREYRAKVRRKAITEFRGGFRKIGTLANMVINPVFAIKKILRSHTFADIKEEFAEKWNIRTDATGRKIKRSTETPDNIIQAQLNDSHVFGVIAKLHADVNTVYADVESLTNKPDASYVSRQDITKPTNKQDIKPEQRISSMLSGLCGAGLLTGIAYGLYKMWPMLKHTLKRSGSSALDAINPTLPNVDGFNTIEPYKDTRNTTKVLTDKDIADKLATAESRLTTIDFTPKPVSDVDESPVSVAQTKPGQSTVIKQTSIPKQQSIDKSIDTPNEAAVKRVENTDQSPSALAQDYFGSKTDPGIKTKEEIEATEANADTTFDKTLEDASTNTDKDVEQLKTSIDDAHDKLSTIITTFNTTFNNEKNPDTSIRKVAQSVLDETVNIYKVINVSEDSILAKTELPGFVDNIKLQHDSQIFNDLAKTVTHAIDLMQIAENEYQTECARLTAIDDKLNEDIDESFDSSQYSLVTINDLQSVTSGIDALSTLLNPVNRIMSIPGQFADQADAIKTQLNEFNPEPSQNNQVPNSIVRSQLINIQPIITKVIK